VKRVLAVGAAVCLVVAAVLARRALDDDGGRDGDGTDFELICGTDLAAVCDGLASEGGISVVVEDESITAARVQSGELTLDRSAWLAAAPWPAIGAVGAGAAGGGFPDLAGSAVLADSPVVIVARKDRMEAIVGACGEPTWACIGEHAGGSWTELGGQAAWGRVEVALPPATTGAGTVAVSQAVASKVGRTDYAINDIDEEPATSAWFDRFASQSKANQRDDMSPLGQFLRVPGSLGVVGALESEAEVELGHASNASSMRTVIPEPRARAEVRLWSESRDTLGDAIERLDLDRLTSSLTDSGWNADDPAGTGIMASEDQGPYPDAGLPDAGVLAAVATRWEGVR
jgi:hypothetical protein